MGTKWAKWIQVAPQLGAVFAKVDLKWNWCSCYIAAANRSSVARKPSIAPSLHQLKLHQWIRSVHICSYPSLLNYHALALSVRAGFDARVPTLCCARPTAGNSFACIQKYRTVRAWAEVWVRVVSCMPICSPVQKRGNFLSKWSQRRGKTRRRMARERRGAESPVVSMGTLY